MEISQEIDDGHGDHTNQIQHGSASGRLEIGCAELPVEPENHEQEKPEEKD